MPTLDMFEYRGRPLTHGTKMISNLSSRLFEEVKPGFFRLLGYESALLYLDAVDAIASSLPSRGGGLTRADTVEIVCDILRMNPGVSLEDETPADSTIALRGNLLLNKLISSGWIEVPERNDYQKEIFLDAHAETMLAALRQIAKSDPAQFTGRLRNACHTLCDVNASTSLTWDDLRACLENLEAGMRELKTMSKSVERLTRRQLGAATLGESVAIVYGDFSSEIGNKCYRELVRAQLPEKLVAARRSLGVLTDHNDVLERLQRGVMHHDKTLNAGEASAVVMQTLEHVELAILSVEPLTERVDARTAEFARRSRARIYYLSSVGSSRARNMQDVFSLIAERYSGVRLANVTEEIALPGLQIGDFGMICGDSLRTPPAARALNEIEAVEDDISDEDKEHCVSEMASNIAFSVTVDRAHRFLEIIGCSHGKSMSSADMDIRGTSDEIEDLISVLLYANTDDADYKVEVPDEPGINRQTDVKGGYKIERFEVTRNE